MLLSEVKDRKFVSNWR